VWESKSTPLLKPRSFWFGAFLLVFFFVNFFIALII
jgi:hypothetical protein